MTLSTQAKLESHILSFYQNMYTRDEEVEHNTEARLDCFQYLKTTVTEEHNQELLKPITREEITAAVKQLPAGKAPGVDAIPSQFYQAMWEDIEFVVFNFVSESITRAHIDEELIISKITLIPKL